MYTAAAVERTGPTSPPEVAPERGTEGNKKASRIAVWSWVLYDFSNTIFSISVLTYFFPLWLGDELGAGAWVVNLATAVSAVFVVVTAPLLGAVADLRQRRLPYLVTLTVVAVLLTAGLEIAGGVFVAVALFVTANVAYQSALQFYNALLPGVAAGRGVGRISGYGTAAGYIGTILALVLLPLLVAEQGFGGFVAGGPEAVRSLLGPLGGWINTGAQTNQNTFLPTAILYLVFSLPAFFFVPDPPARAPRTVRFAVAYRDVVSTLKELRGTYGAVGVFILSTVLYTDAANAAVSNMALYGRQVFGMGDAGITGLLLFSTVFAIAGSVGFGAMSDRAGPKKALVAVLVLWLVAITLSAAAVAPWMLFVAGPLVGVALGGTWTVSRVMLVALSPPEKLGEFFGLFSLAGKVSAVLGPAVTALLLWAFEDLLGTGAYRVAIGSLALILAAGLFLLLRVPDARPDPNVEEDAG